MRGGGRALPVAVERHWRVSTRGCDKVCPARLQPIVAFVRVAVNRFRGALGQATVQAPSWTFKPRVRRRFRLIAAALVVHQALFLVTPR